MIFSSWVARHIWRNHHHWLLGAVGGVTAESPYGAYTIKLPLYDDTEARFSVVCLHKVTETFHRYPIMTKDGEFHITHKFDLIKLGIDVE